MVSSYKQDSHKFVNNIFLIGMPGVGKTTLGRLLAKENKLAFIDTDVLFEKKIKNWKELAIKDFDRFKKEEELICLSIPIETRNAVIASGGSVVYSKKGMEYIRKFCTIYYLKADLKLILGRINDPAARGIAGLQGRSFPELYKEREGLYEQYADITIPILFKESPRQTIEKIDKFLFN